MNDQAEIGKLAKPDLGVGRKPPARHRGLVTLKRAILTSVAGVLGVLILTSVLPPLVADQSDRAVVNAPVKLLTAPIDGDVTSLAAETGSQIDSRSRVAEIVNRRIDRSTLIMLQGKQSDTQENLRAIRSKRESDAAFIHALTEEIAMQTAIVQTRYEEQIVELRAQVGAAKAATEEKKQVMTRQADMVARDVAAPSMITAATQQFNGAKFLQESIEAKLQQKQSQLDSAQKNVFVGDDVHDLAALIQKKRDMELDIERLGIEETQVAAAFNDQKQVLGAEEHRLASLERAAVDSPGSGEVISVGASVGRHVNAGDTLARMVDCEASFVVAIFSYRQGSDLAVGARVSIDAGAAGLRGGTITEVLPKTSDKVDETYAVPFPQTERRELYVLVKPDTPLRRVVATGGPDQCDIGRWVTVTRADGWIPSSSVLWHAVGRRFASGAQAAVEALPQAWAAVRGGLLESAAAPAQARAATE